VKIKRIRRRISYKFYGPADQVLSVKGNSFGSVRAYLFCLWHGVYPQHAVRVMATVREGSARAAEDLYMEVEPFGVSVDFALGGKS